SCPSQICQARFVLIIEQMVVKAQQLRQGHVPKHRRADITNELGIALSAAIIVDDDFQKIRLRREFIVTSCRAKNGVEGVDMFNMETDLQIGANPFYRVMDLLQHLVFAVIEKLVPKKKLGELDQQPPKFDKITIGGALVGLSSLHKLIQFVIALFRALKVDAAIPPGFLVMFAKASDT